MSLCLCIIEVRKNTKGTVWMSLEKLAGMQSFMVTYSLAYSLWFKVFGKDQIVYKDI